MNVCIHTLGCKQNYAESSYLRDQFRSAGHELVGFDVQFDVLLVNTCSVTERADAECRKIVRRALRQCPDAFVAITGCYAQLQPEEIASIDGVDAVFGARYKFSITSLITDFSKRNIPLIFTDDSDDLDDLTFVPALVTDAHARTRAFLKVQDGCDYSCSFCTIPRARGAGRSMAANDVLNSVRQLAESGYKEVVLTGINLGEYKAPGGERFVDVVQALDREIRGLRFRISSIEPNKLSNEIIDCVAQSQVFCRHFHIPLQSGSDTILRAMRRRYTAAYYAGLIDRIRAAMPDAGIGIDVICGFPGETDELFAETVEFLEKLPFSYLHVFRYSERANTAATAYADPVPERVRKQRTTILRELSARKHHEFLQAQVGTNAVVIVEKPDPETGLQYGYASNYARVCVGRGEYSVNSTVHMHLSGVGDEVMHGVVLRVENPTAQSEYFPLPVMS
jgi:threonylcarbamoyladenosine tRNA methylthiotransferase MtaB